MLAAIISELLVIRTVWSLLYTLADIHTCTAFRAFDDARQQISVFVFLPIIAFIFCCLQTKSGLCFLPVFYGNDRLMDAVGQKVIIIPHNTVIVAGAMNLFLLSASIGDFAAVGGVSQNILDVGCCEHIAPRVLMG